MGQKDPVNIGRAETICPIAGDCLSNGAVYKMPAPFDHAIKFQQDLAKVEHMLSEPCGKTSRPTSEPTSTRPRRWRQSIPTIRPASKKRSQNCWRFRSATNSRRELPSFAALQSNAIPDSSTF